MTQDKLLLRNRLIGKRLEQLAAAFGRQLGGSLLSGDHRLREVFKAQDRLLTALERLVEPAPLSDSA